MPTFDFTQIRGDTPEGQRRSFEQLVCHLARVEESGGEFRRIEGSGGDGGVEALRILPAGGKVGYQAKYYPSRDEIDWSKLDHSVATALAQHPDLSRYVVALPCDFTGKRAARAGSTAGVWGKWDGRVAAWTALAASRGVAVRFEPWTAFELEAALCRPDAQHLIPYFFDRRVFTREWMQRQLDRTLFDLQARYSPDEHVDTESLRPFDVLLHRENLVGVLRAVFEGARSSDLKAVAALVEGHDAVEEKASAAAEARRQLVALAGDLDPSLDRPWPVCDWGRRWYAFTRSLVDLEEAILPRVPGARTPERVHLRDRMAGLTRMHALLAAEVFGGPWAPLLPIEGARAALFVGRAGAGKSHLLARGAETAWHAGTPLLFLLGQHVADNDPRDSILVRLGLAGWSFGDLLSALNLAAEAAGSRALLVIDALNEGRGTDVWHNQLAGFIREVNEYDRIFLLVSCREEYLPYVVPSEVIADPRPYPRAADAAPDDCAPLGKLVRVAVEGFRTEEEREAALRKFMDANGIARPTAPVLDEVFFFPLFMSSVCRSMAHAGIKVFPRGLHGARDIFGFVLETKARALGTRYDHTPRVHAALLDALGGLAQLMVERKADHVPLHEAIDRVELAFKAFPLGNRSWLEVLEGSDILRRDIDAPGSAGAWSGPYEVVRFSFQRLQDNLMADHLVSRCRGSELDDAFDPGGPFAFLIRRSVEREGMVVRVRRPNNQFEARWIGVLGAFWAAVAETHGRELLDLRSFASGRDAWIYRDEFRPVVQTSIRERKETAFTSRTWEIFELLWEDARREKLAILLSTACVPGHAWNADMLARRLLSRSPAGGDASWLRQSESDLQSPLFVRASEVAEWALNAEASADPEVVRLAAITLLWLCSVANSTVRGMAEKGLANLLNVAPQLFAYLDNLFHDVDDRFVSACLQAARSGLSR